MEIGSAEWMAQEPIRCPPWAEDVAWFWSQVAQAALIQMLALSVHDRARVPWIAQHFRGGA